MASLTRKSAALLISASVLLTSTAQLLFRFAMMTSASVPHAELTFIASVTTAFTAANFLVLFLGVLLYGVSMVIWVVALTRYPVSLAYPMLSISYVLVYLAATQWTALNESAGVAQSIGIGFIGLGVWLLSRDPNDS